MKAKQFCLGTAVWLSCLLWAAPGASAATISGVVADAEGAGLAGAQITARQAESDFSLTAISGEDGEYSLESLPPGNYTITIRRAGFADWTQQDVRAGENGETLRLDFQLRPSEAQTVVRGEEELNPNVFVLRLDTNEVIRELRRRGASADLPREFRADQNYFGGVYGQPLRAVEWVRPRSPLGAFHGTIYEGHQNSSLSARTFFTVGDYLPSRRNQYGFTANGPLVSDKLSFNFAWSQLRDTGYVNGNVQIPQSAEERTPRTTDPAKRTVIQALLSAYPEGPPNRATPSSPRLHNTNAIRDITSTAFSTRLDYRPREGDQIAFEQRYRDDTEQPFELVVGQNPLSLLRPQSFHLSYVRGFRPSTVGRFSFHFDRLGAAFVVTDSYRDLVVPLGYPSAPNFGPGDFTGLGPGTDYPFERIENRYYFSPDITHTRGRHTLTMGAMFNRIQFNDSLNEMLRGGFNFQTNICPENPNLAPGETQDSFVNFLWACPSSYEIGLGDAYRGFRHWEHAFYVHDTFRWRPSWTLSFGLRYEIMTKPFEVNDRTQIPFDADANNVAPQFGFAWNPGGGGAVIRGGYGITFGAIHPLLYQRARFNPPDLLLVQVQFPNMLDPLASAQDSAVGGKRSEYKLMSPDLTSPYSHVYTLQVQKDLPGNFSLTAGYAGERTIKLPRRVVGNRGTAVPGIVASTGNIDARRPNPNYLQITTAINGVMAYFDAFQLAVNRRLSRGMALNARYTFSKTLSSADTTFAEIETGSGVAQDMGDVVSDLKGVTKFDSPHSLTLGYSYELPAWRDQRAFLSAVFGRWRISGTTTFKSGTPLNITSGSDARGFGNVDGVRATDRPNLLDPSILGKSIDHPDTARSLLAVDTCQPVPAVGPDGANFRYLRCQYFDTNIPVGGRGDVGYNVFRADGVHNWNVALEKEFPFREAAAAPHLLFRSEFINFMNHPQFAEPNLRMASDTFGEITNTANRGRLVSFLLRLRW
jgi:hypothetical protein